MKAQHAKTLNFGAFVAYWHMDDLFGFHFAFQKIFY